MSRISTVLVNAREAFAYHQMSQVPPMPVADIQAALKDPNGTLGGKTMASKRLYEIRAAVLAGTLWEVKVNKHEGKVAKAAATPDMVQSDRGEDKDAANVPDSVVEPIQSEVSEATSESSHVPDIFKD
jgi:hypothetical protein